MTITDIIADIKTHFLPYTLIMDDAVVRNNIVRAIRRVNASAPPRRVASDIPIANRVDLSAYNVLHIIKVYHNGTFPDTEQASAKSVILGYTELGRLNVEALAANSVYVRSVNALLNAEYKWKWEPPYLYIDDPPDDATLLYIVYYGKLAESGSPETDIPDNVADWIFEYALALCKIDEGNILARSESADVNFGGERLISQGREDKDKLERELDEKKKVILWGGHGPY